MSDGATEPTPLEEHAVIVDLRLKGGDFGSEAERQTVYDLEQALITAIEAADVGDYDGNEFGAGGATLYAYGPDADALFAVMEPALRAFAAEKGSSATLRYGSADDLDAREVVISLRRSRSPFWVRTRG